MTLVVRSIGVANSYTRDVRILNNSLFFAGSLMCALVVAVGFRRRILNRLPMFFAYMAFCGLQTLLYLALWSLADVSLYGWLLVASTLGSFFLELSVIYELWNTLVLSYSSSASIFRPLPRWTAAVLLLIATAIAALLPQNVSSESFQVYSTLNVSLNLVDLGLLITLLLVTRLVAISWGILPAGVGLGIAVNDVGGATAAALVNHMGTHLFLDTILEGLSALSAAIWLTCVLLYTKPQKGQEFRTGVSNKDSGTLELLNGMIREWPR